MRKHGTKQLGPLIFRWAENKIQNRMGKIKMTYPKIYVANLGKYNEGVLQGEWFDYPFDMDEIKEKIGINNQYEEWAIHDYEGLPFNVGEYEDIEDLNEMLKILDHNGLLEYPRLAETIFHYDGIRDGLQRIENVEYRVYDDCNSMADVAQTIVEEGLEINEYYLDLEAFGRDLAIGGDIYNDVYDQEKYDDENENLSEDELQELVDKKYDEINPTEYAEELYDEGAIDQAWLVERNYIDLRALGRDLEIEGSFEYAGDGTYVEFY